MATIFFRSKKGPFTVAGLIFALTLMVLAPTARASTPFLSSSEVQALTGKSIAEWGAEWWQWAFLHPEVLVDKTGKSGPLGEVGGDVFFAEGSGGHPANVKYAVPGGKYVLVPVATYIWTFFEPCAEQGCATEIINDHVFSGATDAYLIVDGVPVADMSAHLVLVTGDTVPFQVDAGPIGPDGYGGILDALQGGYWVMLRPLSPGPHHISFGATVPLIDGNTGEPIGGTLDLKAKLRLEAAK